MNPPLMPGRCNLITDQEESIRELAEQMNYAGLSAAIFRDMRESVCTLSVPQEQADKARDFLRNYFSASSESRKEEDMANFMAAYSERIPKYITAMERQKDTTQSAALFLAAGISLLLLAFRNQPLVQILWGLLLSGFGIYTLTKNRELRNAYTEGSRFKRTVSAWFLSTYSAEDLDRILSSCLGRDTFSKLSEGELREVRLSSIRDYIKREYALADTDWLNSLSESIYQHCYETN